MLQKARRVSNEPVTSTPAALSRSQPAVSSWDEALGPGASAIPVCARQVQIALDARPEFA